MAKQAQPKNSPTTTPQTNQNAAAQRTRASIPDSVGTSKSFFGQHDDELVFGKNNFLWIAIGAAMILLGILLMLGGEQPNPETWDKNIIYNPRIITVAPILIIAGVITEIYAIFKD